MIKASLKAFSFLKIPIIILFKIIGRISKICSALKSYSLIPKGPYFITENELRIVDLFFL